MFAKSMPSYLTYFPDMLFIEKCLKDFIPVFWNVSLFRPYRANTKLLSIRTMSISLIYELRHPYHINKTLMNFCTQIILFPISSWWDLNCGYMIWKQPICQLCQYNCPQTRLHMFVYSANVYVLVLWRKHLYVYLTRYGVRDNV